ncbi:P-loop containing nucleoside triphosphate hydrolase [Pyrrhoderma noxium]|uniref:P-loop containing nucleoside triphosphate hydrolase n=1 Tax=Pyrrhoderma noxium TaxID=2282107 RepID=A0A286UVC8_9AGAM|nr:P-loop containing nucleoside triphosphate hydrolase [Pyrrhoderma noxium]
MLLRLSGADILNADLIHVSSGRIKHTFVQDISGRHVAEIEWTGKDKKCGGLIRLDKNDPIKVLELFGGCKTVTTFPDRLLIPTRIGYTWVATPDSLFVCDVETGEVIMKYHEHCVQIGNGFVPSPVKKFGQDYLEFADLPDDTIVELIVGFPLVNIMRRARFDLPKYHFPLVDGSSEERVSAGEILLRVKSESWKKVALIMTSLNIFTSENMLHDSKDGSIDDGYMKFNSMDFVTNGLLSVDDSQPGAIEYTQNSLTNEKSTSNDASFLSNGLLDDDLHVTDAMTSNLGFEHTGLLNSLPEKSIANIENESHNLFNDPGLLGMDAPDDMPTLSQLLHIDRRQTSESDSRAKSSYGISGLVSATTFDGKTIYLNKKTRTRHNTTLRQSTANLLSIPVHKLKDHLSEVTASQLSQSEAGPSKLTSPSSAESQLWVDRYRPSRFTELLGDERVHRETMAWLKEWDYCVFGKRKALNRPKKMYNGQTQSTDLQNKYEDVHHRPREKILLLSGPAGFGKTTLAHVAACQSGYEVMEINASDTRSGQAVDDRIRPALESGSAIGSKKPVCVIIDEIDGATGAGDNASSFVQKLINITLEKGKKKGRGDKKKDSSRPLLRPLICICNDLYASSLTKLRQHARIIRFSRPADVHLTKRLRTICETEGLRAESRALTTLVGIAKGDMRSCLNTLQFIKARNQEVTEPVIRTATVGLKEGDTSFNSLMSGIFAPIPRKRAKELGLSELEERSYVKRISTDIDSSGSVDKVALGCFEHYTNLRHYEASLSRHEKGIQWLTAFDSLSGAMRSEREYGLMPYLSYSLVGFHPLFSERGGPKIERPKADWDALTKTRTNEEVYKSLAKCVQTCGMRHTGMRHFLSNEIMQLELSPFLNRIISPPLRPVNSQVTKPHERELLSRVVEVMTSLELQLIQEKAEDGQLIYRLEPPIDAFITYDGKRSANIPVQRYATRQMIAGEIDARLTNQNSETSERGKTKGAEFFQKAYSGVDGLTLGKRKMDDIADRPPVDFFGRPIAATKAPNSKRSRYSGPHSSKGDPTEKKFKVSYKYNEGNSSAVRKPLKVSAFL